MSDNRIQPARRQWWTLSPGAMIVLRSLIVFDIWLLVVVGVILASFMERPAGLIFGAACWIGAALLMGIASALERAHRRRRR